MTEQEPTGVRKVIAKIGDLYGNLLIGKLGTEVTEAQVADFCAGCGHLQSDGICEFGKDSQTIYVARNWCGRASIDGQRGGMTSEGFKEYGRVEP